MDFPIKNGGFPSFFVCFPEGNYRFPRPLCAWEIPWVLPAQELVQVMGTQVEKAAGFQRIKYGTPPLSSMICPAHHVEFLDLSMISPWIFSMKPPFFLGKNTIFLWFSDWKPPFFQGIPGAIPGTRFSATALRDPPSSRNMWGAHDLGEKNGDFIWLKMGYIIPSGYLT